jgi:flagellar basal-body rod modification protein FlgD
MVNAVVRGNGGFLLDLGAQGNVAFKDVQQIL